MTSTMPTEDLFTIYGLSVGHGCADCERLTIAPAAIHTAGASYELVASITAGHTHDGEARDGCRAERGHAAIRIENIPAIVAELQMIHDQAVQAEADQRIPAEWPIRP
jgi:hypothetical protein